MEATTKAVRLEYSVYSESDENDVVRLLSQVFTAHDPMAVALDLKPEEFETLFKWLSPKVTKEGLTTVARRADNREVVAVMFVEDAGTEPPPGIEQLSSRFEPIFEYLGHIEEEYRRGNEPKPGLTAHLFFCGVDDEFAGQGVAQNLLNEGIRHIFNRGYQFIVAEATSKKSQHVSSKIGFVDKVQRPYAEFEFDGRRVFESIADEGGTILMELSSSDFS